MYVCVWGGKLGQGGNGRIHLELENDGTRKDRLGIDRLSPI